MPDDDWALGQVTAESENDAYAQVSDSGISSGTLIGTVLIMNLGLLEDTTPPESGVPS